MRNLIFTLLLLCPVIGYAQYNSIPEELVGDWQPVKVNCSQSGKVQEFSEGVPHLTFTRDGWVLNDYSFFALVYFQGEILYFYKYSAYSQLNPYSYFFMSPSYYAQSGGYYYAGGGVYKIIDEDTLELTLSNFDGSEATCSREENYVATLHRISLKGEATQEEDVNDVACQDYMDRYNRLKDDKVLNPSTRYELWRSENMRIMQRSYDNCMARQN